jgi:hypothetical protein
MEQNLSLRGKSPKPPSARTPSHTNGTPARAGSDELRPGLPPDILALFGKPPLIGDEDADAYADLLARLAAALRPTDIVEWLSIKDVAGLTWEGQRLRRQRAALQQLDHKGALETLLAQVLQCEGAADSRGRAATMAQGYAAGDWQAIGLVQDVLARNGIDIDAIGARVLRNHLNSIERIDRMMAATDLRRDAILAGLEQKREGRARRLRQVPAETVELEAN